MRCLSWQDELVRVWIDRDVRAGPGLCRGDVVQRISAGHPRVLPPAAIAPTERRQQLESELRELARSRGVRRRVTDLLRLKSEDGVRGLRRRAQIKGRDIELR